MVPFLLETFCPTFLYTNCKGSNDLLMEIKDPLSVPENLRYWDAIQGLFNGADYSEQENAQSKAGIKNQRKRSFQRNKRGRSKKERNTPLRDVCELRTLVFPQKYLYIFLCSKSVKVACVSNAKFLLKP